MPYIVIDAGPMNGEKSGPVRVTMNQTLVQSLATKLEKRLQGLGFEVTRLGSESSASSRGRQIAKLQPDFALSLDVNDSKVEGKPAGAEIYVALGQERFVFEQFLLEALRLGEGSFRVLSKEAHTRKVHERLVRSETGIPRGTDYHAIIREAWSGAVPVVLLQWYTPNSSEFSRQEDAYVEAIAAALARLFKLPEPSQPRRTLAEKKAEPKTAHHYRVICGSYQSLEEARQVQAYLQKQFPNAWVQPVDQQR